jgi:hypothetical protein
VTRPSENIPRVIALIDLPELRRHIAQAGGLLGPDLRPVVRQLETGLAPLAPTRSEVPPHLGAVYVYSRPETGRAGEDERLIYKPLGARPERECSACYRPCTHCKGGGGSLGGRGRDNPIGADLMTLARDDAYDWAVLVSADLLLIPVVRYVQAHGRKIIHGCFPPLAADLTRECWASVDLRRLTPAHESPAGTSLSLPSGS